MSPQPRSGRTAAHQRAQRAAAARAAQQRKQRRLRAVVVGIIGAVVVLAVVLTMLPNGGGSKSASTTTTQPTTTTTEVVDRVIPDDPSENTSPAFEYGTGECAPDTKPTGDAKPKTFTAAPMKCLKDGVDYSAVVTTSEGAFTIDLLEHRAPGTVNNFVQLAKWGWFDGDDFHRVVPGFVNQAGDPYGDPPGTGGPGYQIPDELPPAVQSYARWAVAMANSGPNTNGSQWFTCIDCSKLPNPGYSLFGQVTEGTDVVQAINDLGTADGPPSKPVTITSVEIVEG